MAESMKSADERERTEDTKTTNARITDTRIRSGKITEEAIKDFKKYLQKDEKATATIQKYIREVEYLAEFLQGEELRKEKMIEYRNVLQQQHKACTVNVKISALNAYLAFSGNEECKVRYLRVQHNAFIDEDRELEEMEYKRLLLTAKKKKSGRMYYILLTLSGTGIRISELKYITAEAVTAGRSEINLKGKNRKIFLSRELRKKLKEYMERQNIQSGPIFTTRTGKPLDRSNICHEMKKLCAAANVDESKVFPHNFRHLFARKYFEIDNNLPHLADILGHSSIETTRIYVAASTKEYQRVLEKMSFI